MAVIHPLSLWFIFVSLAEAAITFLLHASFETLAQTAVATLISLVLVHDAISVESD
jgi:hypothetical protein